MAYNYATAAARKRFARTTLAARDAIALDANVANLRECLLERPEISQEAVAELVRVACSAPELANEEAASLGRMSWEWLETGRYDAVMRASAGRLTDLDEAISFVEEVLAYRLNWMLNGLVRLLEDRANASGDGGQAAAAQQAAPEERPAIQEWVKLLPQYLRYGIAAREPLWVMTLGFHDRGYAEFLLGRYREEREGLPRQFRDVLRWLVERESDLVEQSSAAGWPRYWQRILTETVARYRNL